MDCCSAAKPSFFWEENYCSLGSLATQSERPDSGPEEQVPKCVVKERTLYVFTEVKICFPFGFQCEKMNCEMPYLWSLEASLMAQW